MSGTQTATPTTRALHKNAREQALLLGGRRQRIQSAEQSGAFMLLKRVRTEKLPTMRLLEVAVLRPACPLHWQPYWHEVLPSELRPSESAIWLACQRLARHTSLVKRPPDGYGPGALRFS